MWTSPNIGEWPTHNPSQRGTFGGYKNLLSGVLSGSAFFTFRSSRTNVVLVNVRPHRLVRSRTPAFHAGNTGSNPVEAIGV